MTVLKLLSFLIFINCFSINANSQTYLLDSIPVRLSTLEVRPVGNNARLDWKVICLIAYAKFEIQRSSNGIDYTTINTFEADRLRCTQPFDFTDVNSTGKIFYRIRVGDLDGKFYNSKIVAITGKEKGFEINSLVPSVVTNRTLLSISAATNTNKKAEVVITNLQGTIVKRISIILNKGVIDVPITLNNLATGNYILTVNNGSSEIKTIRFTKL